VGDQRPDDAGVFIGDGHARLRGSQSLLLIDDPETSLIGFCLCSIDDGARPMNQRRKQNGPLFGALTTEEYRYGGLNRFRNSGVLPTRAAFLLCRAFLLPFCWHFREQ
jgi:hypothetical protein